MEEKRITEIKKKVNFLLASRQLKKAIDTLAEGIEELQDWSLQTRFSQMQTSYNYLLEYMRNGTPDPGREIMYGKLTGECYLLNDFIEITRLTEHSTTVYCQNRRKYKNRDEIELLHTKLRENNANTGVTNLLPKEECNKVVRELMQEHEQLLNDIFAIVWCCIVWDKSFIEKTKNILNDDEIAVNDRAMIVSAITLSLLKCFEPAKAILLIEMLKNSHTVITTRAIIGVILAVCSYNDRVKYYPELTSAIKSLRDDERISRQIKTIQIQLLRCRETQKIDRKMREEIIPAMLKNPHINIEKTGMDILHEIEQEEDKNPEWKEWIKKDGIKDKLEEMSKWQIEGADVYMSTFSQLKKYPFFNELKNWFRPFDTKTPALADILPDDVTEKKSILSLICASRFFCNSDKYSFCLTFNQIPEEQRSMLASQLGGEDIAEQMPDTQTTAPKDKESEIEGNQYIQDLYRFFKLSYFKKEFSDPFTLSLNLLQSEHLAAFINSHDALYHIFSFMLEKGYHAEAIEVGKIYERYDSTNEQFYQELGYCLQKERCYTEAIDRYTRADIIKPDNLWTLRHIAQCYRLNGETEKALDYYLLSESIAPDDISLLRQTGDCLVSLKRYDEAFARFFKAEYLNPGSLNALRAIAWCSFLTSKDKQAQEYYGKILSNPKTKFTDYINAAHTEWVASNKVSAVELYKKAKKMCGNDELFADCLEKDRPTLMERGVSDCEYLLMRDLI